MSEDFENKLRAFLLEKFELNPLNMEFFLSAFTHSSFKNKDNADDYEKLEFLGDSCVGIIVASNLYGLNIPLKDMSIMKREIVQSSSLAYVSQKIGLDKYLRIGRTCKIITKSMLEDVYESFVGAVFLSFGFEKTKEIVEKTLWKSFVNKELVFAEDYKTKLQELVQRNIRKKITYVLVGTNVFDDGRKTFCVSVMVGEDVLGKGEGKRLKDAEQMAAKEAFLSLT